MSFRGYIKDGKVLVNDLVDLPNGTEVDLVPRAPRARPRKPATSRPPRRVRPFLEQYGNVIGKAKGLPKDAARNIDHYLYGAPKRP